VALSVALLNTAYQDGRSEAPYPAWLGKAIRFVVPLLLPVAVLAIYAIGVRVDSYGLTVARGWGLLVAVIALAYALGYAWAALGKDAWMGGMGLVNVYVALATVVLLTLMLSPVLSPERLAAASQAARVLATQEEDSYRYLRFDSGRYGRTRLRRLAELQDHPQAEAIRAAAKRELARKDPLDQRGSGGRRRRGSGPPAAAAQDGEDGDGGTGGQQQPDRGLDAVRVQVDAGMGECRAGQEGEGAEQGGAGHGGTSGLGSGDRAARGGGLLNGGAPDCCAGRRDHAVLLVRSRRGEAAPRGRRPEPGSGRAAATQGPVRLSAGPPRRAWPRLQRRRRPDGRGARGRRRGGLRRRGRP
jgi:hypothetical protein